MNKKDMITERLAHLPGDDTQTKINRMAIRSISSHNCADEALDLAILADAYIREHIHAIKWREHVEKMARP